MSDITSLEGPVERVNGELAIRIPLDAGGKDLVECARGVGRIDGDYFVVIIQQWLADKLRIGDGDVVRR